jgi:hypothetical protein
MFSLKSYFRVLNLEASNNNLLGIYYQLLERDGLTDLKSAILSKIKLREEIQDQLRICLEENYTSKQTGLVSKAYSNILPALVKSQYSTQRIYRPLNWEFCIDCEVENIRNYYKILFNKRYSRKVTNLLLEQKAKIEAGIIESRE